MPPVWRCWLELIFSILYKYEERRKSRSNLCGGKKIIKKNKGNTVLVERYVPVYIAGRFYSQVILHNDGKHLWVGMGEAKSVVIRLIMYTTSYIIQGSILCGYKRKNFLFFMLLLLQCF